MAEPVAAALIDAGPELPDAHALPTVAADEQLWGVPPDRLAEVVAAHMADRWRFATLVGTDEGPEGGGFAVEAVLARPGRALRRLRADLPADRPAYASIARRVPAALWDERELHDLLGITPLGHPDLRRLVLHDEFPDGYHPLRSDAPTTPPPGRAANPYRPFVAQGEGVYALPVGPIHAGVIEPGGFTFSAMGESILYLDARLFFTHRGIEKLVEGRMPAAALPIVERSCGVCTVAHATAFSQALERLAPGFEVPPRGQALRALLLELERLYNHVGDLGNICAGIGFNVGATQLGWLKEQLLRVNESLTGHRYLMGIVAPGGLAFEPDLAALAALPGRLRTLDDDLARILAIVDRTDSAADRFRGAGTLPRETAEALGAVGVAARASGVSADVRADLPTPVQRALGVPVATAAEGDVAARFRVRREEVATSLELVRALMAALPGGAVSAPLRELAARASAVGWAESPRGASWIWVRTDAAGRLARVHLRSGSYANWPSVAAAAAGNLVPDFPLVNKSFELCYACTDR